MYLLNKSIFLKVNVVLIRQKYTDGIGKVFTGKRYIYEVIKMRGHEKSNY